MALHGATMCGARLPPGQVAQLVAVLLRPAVLQASDPQAIANSIWAAAKMEQQLAAEQVPQLVAAMVDLQQDASPQHLSNTLWAVATMAMAEQVPAEQLQQLVAALVAKLQQADPQAVANTLWAVASLPAEQQQQPSVKQLQQLVAGLVAKLQQADPQQVANTLWACAQLSYLPAQLLTALAADQQQFQELVAVMSPQELANAAWACGQLGATGSTVLLSAVVQQAVQRLGEGSSRESSSSISSSSSNSFGTQELCNLAWAVAVLDLQQHAGHTHVLACACRQQWEQTVAEDVRQLYQVHLWLLDGQLAGGQGLLGPLTQQQLQQCKEAWDALLATYTTSSQLQADVLAALLRLPHAWHRQPQAEQLAQPDGALSIDITAMMAGGEMLAVEVDGPWHFRRPDSGLMGTTLYRNRALAARGYRVVSVPYQEWDALGRDKQAQQQYLERLLLGSGEQQARRAGGGKRHAPAAVRSAGSGSVQPADAHVAVSGSGGRQQQVQQQGQLPAQPAQQAPLQPAGRVRRRRRVAVK